ncbi:Gfo/Idh/MocA family protein [Cellvibrio japonicus]|uniref:AGR_pAT_7p, (AF151698) GlnP/GlnQ homolog n=1 Tax=Cellvibrio japonicus (strain Ueda107) TaxID=498211 RepID=B3PKT1_CELJU|nr:Gfo/Idh/MocA family oxidoreductase [Cellvibrio japonicus]ACE86211.1 AGR_pAT_7p, (AF151698) GlnP/GlnQ homolog [Cellvibrio japonicus Ueda107]QEI11493.1 Gfo/Idh/MocA family oxidoreductase [Cellvibrio japonicus]QEI15067.1 Gfo/Idh/MocA family oxidoreductase [Cellvibrio japonicus]QEI18647.1 Gfo/Idh/MocA family oxidoreductase [Cellvibrio japonicus]
MRKVRWGVLSTAKIGRTKVIPALQASDLNQVVAIGSRDLAGARQCAADLGIEKAYGSYEALLADPDIDAIYNPLPNHLHVDWSIKALQAGKHVLCEKPLGMDTADAQRLVEAAAGYPHLKTMEAFMYRFHPQWQTAKQLVDSGKLGQLRTIHSQFSYNNREAGNIRNKRAMGGGALLDIGCYCISLSRWLYNSEPLQVMGQITPFPGQEVDCQVSGILQFAEGNATFTAATKIEPRQYIEASGEAGSLAIAVPFNPPGDRPAEITLKHNGEADVLSIAATDQYRVMGDAFACSVLDDTPVPTPLSDAIANMRIIDAIFTSAATGRWIAL